jgi:ribonuclease HII
MPRVRDPRDLQCTRRLEALASRQGWRRIAGCDEAGRGALLGPLYAAAVIFDAVTRIPGIDDSKKLSPAERSKLAAQIRKQALAFHVVAIPAEEVDALNVYEASRQAMIRAIENLDPRPDYVLTDAMPLSIKGEDQVFHIPYSAIVHGDAQSVSIAAASILAKVERDARMEELARLYPQYQLDHNKGYGTAEHLEALARYGPCREHRKTFQPVKDYLLPLFPFSGSA